MPYTKTLKWAIFSSKYTYGCKNNYPETQALFISDLGYCRYYDDKFDWLIPHCLFRYNLPTKEIKLQPYLTLREGLKSTHIGLCHTLKL